MLSAHRHSVTQWSCLVNGLAAEEEAGAAEVEEAEAEVATTTVLVAVAWKAATRFVPRACLLVVPSLAPQNTFCIFVKPVARAQFPVEMLSQRMRRAGQVRAFRVALARDMMGGGRSASRRAPPCSSPPSSSAWCVSHWQLQILNRIWFVCVPRRKPTRDGGAGLTIVLVSGVGLSLWLGSSCPQCRFSGFGEEMHNCLLSFLVCLFVCLA